MRYSWDTTSDRTKRLLQRRDTLALRLLDELKEDHTIVIYIPKGKSKSVLRELSLRFNYMRHGIFLPPDLQTQLMEDFPMTRFRWTVTTGRGIEITAPISGHPKRALLPEEAWPATTIRPVWLETRTHIGDE
jgi:hypothetical protein